MKETRKVLITILLVGLSLITVAAADPTMSVSQQPADAGLITADVTVDPAGGEIYSAGYDLHFDTTILEAIEQTQGDFLSHGGVETLEIVNTINNTRGKIKYVETRTGDAGGATEPGLLASITFKVIGTGISDLTLSDVQFYDLTKPTPTRSSTHSPSGGSSGYIPITTPAATPTEMPVESATSTNDDSSSVVKDDGTPTTAEGAAVSVPAESVPTATPTKAPSRPKSAIPGFAAASAVMGLVIVACIIRRRGE